MAISTANVVVGNDGVIAVAATTATAPTSAVSALPTGFNDLGAISDDGVTETRDRSTDTIVIWQNAAVAREAVTESSYQFSFTMVETKKETVELFYGGALDTTAGSLVVIPAGTGGRKSFIIDVKDGAKVKRIYIPEGEVTEVGDVTYQNGEAVGYEITISAYYGTYGTGGTQFTGAAKIWWSNLVTP